MSLSGEVYDLGEVDDEPSSTVPLPSVDPTPERSGVRPRSFWDQTSTARVRPRAIRPRPRRRPARPSLLDPIADTLTLVLPGSGHMLRGRWAIGLAMTSWVGLILSLGWAVHETLSRIDATLPLLDFPREAGLWFLAGLFGALAVLHVTAISLRESEALVAPHPLVSGIASGLIPGWGQLLNGQRIKAAAFVTALWIAAASWGLASAPVEQLFERFDLFLPPMLESFRSPLVCKTALAVVWTLSLYDAITSATSNR